MSQPPPPEPPAYGDQPPAGQPPHAQPPYGQPPYGQPQLYGGPGHGGFAPPDHQQSVLVLVLGILGLVMCQLVSPFAWVMGNRVVREIDASGGQVGGRSAANAGRICGMIGTGLLALGVLALVVLVILVVAGAATST